MKHGFTLLELIIATMVGSMVCGILLTALMQSARFQTIIDTDIDFSSRMGVVAHQLEKDLEGCFIPVQAEEVADAGAAPTDDKKKSDDKNKKESGQPDPGTQKIGEKEKPKPFEKIFYSTNKSGNLDTLTFITNNPLTTYVGKDVGQARPYVVRVQYSLKPEPGVKDSYILVRQESAELAIEKYKNIREFEVIGGIKSCTVTFTARIKKEDKSEKTDKPVKLSYEYKTFNEWVSEQKKDADKEKSSLPRIPSTVEITLSLFDMQNKKDQKYIITCHIPVDFMEPAQEDTRQEDQSKKDEDKAASPGNKAKDQSSKTFDNKQGNDEIMVYNGVETSLLNVESLIKIFNS